MGGPITRSRSGLFLEYTLRMTKGRMRMVGLGSAALLMLALAEAFLLTAVLGDHALSGGLTAAARLTLGSVFGLAELALLVGCVLLPLGRRISDLYAARIIEKANPEFRNDLTAALQLDRDGRTTPAVRAAVRRRAADELGRADVESAVATRRLRVSGLVAGIIAAVAVVYWIVAPKDVLPSIYRAFGADSVPLPTRVRIVAVRPAADTVFLTGMTVDFEADILRNGGQEVVLTVSRDGGKTWLTDVDRFDMARTGPGDKGADRYAARWPSASAAEGSATCRIQCGDAAAERTFTVLPKPQVRNLRVAVAWPAYTGRDETTQNHGHVRALAGSHVTVRAEANLPVNSASLLFETRSPVILKSNGHGLTARFVPSADDRYRIVYHGKHPLVRYESIWYDVRVLRDAGPEVRLIDPAGNAEHSPGDSLPLAAEARDDFGVKDMTLVVSGETTRRIPLVSLPAPGRATRAFEMAMPVARLGRPGDRLACHVETRDFLPPNGQVGLSRSFELVIPGPASPPDEGVPASLEANAPDRPTEDHAAATDTTDEAPPDKIATSREDRAAEELLQMARRDAKQLEALRQALRVREALPGREPGDSRFQEDAERPDDRDGQAQDEDPAKGLGQDPMQGQAPEAGKPADQDGAERGDDGEEQGPEQASEQGNDQGQGQEGQPRQGQDPGQMDKGDGPGKAQPKAETSEQPQRGEQGTEEGETQSDERKQQHDTKPEPKQSETGKEQDKPDGRKESPEETKLSKTQQDADQKQDERKERDRNDEEAKEEDRKPAGKMKEKKQAPRKSPMRPEERSIEKRGRGG